MGLRRFSPFSPLAAHLLDSFFFFFSLLNLLHYCFCLMLLVSCLEARGILVLLTRD